MVDNSIVPTIDVSRRETADLSALDTACRDHGFFFIKGHGLDALIDLTFEIATAFFQTSASNKEQIARDQTNPMGWYDRELTKGKRDHKEIFDFTAPDAPLGLKRNKWPEKPANFRKTLADFHQAFSEAAAETTSLVLQALGLQKDQSSSFRGEPAISPVRLNKYLITDPVPESDRWRLPPLGSGALGQHTDPGVLTLLLQDRIGGLQTKTANGKWVDVEPTPGTVIVNLGDTMQVWTNDAYRAALHRVQPMTKSDRLSIPYFYHPPRDSIIEPIPALANGLPRYRPYAWRDYIEARDTDNYEDVGKADAQISDYRVSV